MYSIFNTNSKKRGYLKEGEPPPKKQTSENDQLVKKLAEKQLQTKVSLSEQLENQKEFQASENFTSVTNYLDGVKDLKDFKQQVASVEELKKLKSYDLSAEDIKLFQDYKSMTKNEFIKVYKNCREEILLQKVKTIEMVIKSNSADKNKLEENEKYKTIFKKPIDELPELEQNFMTSVSESSCDIKKIRKKARSLHNRLLSINGSSNSNVTSQSIEATDRPSSSKSLWDSKIEVKTIPPVKIIDCDKKYTCQPQSWYTIENGKIVKINKDPSKDALNKEVSKPTKNKLFVDDIKNDELVKKLAEKQLQTKDKPEQHEKQKESLPRKNFTFVTNYLDGVKLGEKDLEEFNRQVESVEELSKVKSYDLSFDDIKLFQDYKSMTKNDFVKAYKNCKEEILLEKVERIEMVIKSSGEDTNKLEKSNNYRTILLKPDYELPELKPNYMTSVNKKLLRLKRNSCSNVPSQNSEVDRPSNSKSLWDSKTEVRVMPQVEIIDHDKKYTCKPQYWYTIENGKIVKINNDVSNKEVPKTTKNKLSVDDIKKIPRFKDYEPGQPNNVLFLKNLPKNLSQSFLNNILTEFPKECYSVKIMNGKMKGQCFIEFDSVENSEKALSLINGVILMDKPIVAQFGRAKVKLTCLE